VTPPVGASKDVRATLFMALSLNGETMNATPRQLSIFGKTIPAGNIGDLAGGVRSDQLPPLPPGVTYRSVSVRADGLHIALGGVTTKAFSGLPPAVDGQAVTYSASDGLLGISTSRSIPLLGSLPLTIFAAPRIDGNTLRLEPRSVQVLGRNRPPTDLIARGVLSQVKQESLAQPLPALPDGVRYTGTTVDGSGLKVTLSGVTVKPYSALPATDEDGRQTTYGVKDGLMTVTTSGTTRATPIIVYAKPVITGNILDLAPQQIRMFRVLFPARDVLAQVSAGDTTFPLPALPGGLAYGAVDVQPDGLRLHVSGQNATLAKGMLGGTGC
jgi:hypothetical protein